MLREGYIRFNLQNIEKYNNLIEKNHIKNMEKVNELKEAYLEKANSIKTEGEKTLKRQDFEIAKIKNQIEFLKKQKGFIKEDLEKIPQDIIKKYNNI